MTERKLKFIGDPAHAWLSVPRKDLKTLGIEHEISEFSFQRGKRVYLEEDQDATIYMSRARDAGWKVKFVESFSDRRSWVRSLERYKMQL